LAKKKGVKVQGANGGSEGGSEGNVAKYTIDEILDKASEFIDVYNYEMAQKFCQRALEMDADNVRALETTATLLLEAGDVENAKHCLGRAVTVAPDSGHSKYLSLAQIMDGEDSLGLYRKGIELLTSEVERLAASPASNEAAAAASEGPQPVDKLASAKRELSSSYCAVAELFTTDLCDLEEAEGECTTCIQRAIEADESNPEAWQTKARLHLIKSEFEDAKISMDKSLSLWLPKYMAVLEDRDSALDPVEVCPLLYTTRLATAKILMELEEWEKAVKVLNGLTEEDELVVDTWYLLGLLNKLRADFEAKEAADEAEAKDASEGYKGNARYYLKKALKVHAKSATDDKDMITHVKELIEELGKGDGDDDDDDDEQEGWEDCDEEDSEEEETTMDAS